MTLYDVLHLPRVDRREGLEGNAAALLVFIAFARLVARPVAVFVSFDGIDLPRPEKLFVAGSAPKGVASMLFARLVLNSDDQTGRSCSTSRRS